MLALQSGYSSPVESEIMEDLGLSVAQVRIYYAFILTLMLPAIQVVKWVLEASDVKLGTQSIIVLFLAVRLWNLWGILTLYKFTVYWANIHIFFLSNVRDHMFHDYVNAL